MDRRIGQNPPPGKDQLPKKNLNLYNKMSSKWDKYKGGNRESSSGNRRGDQINTPIERYESSDVPPLAVDKLKNDISTVFRQKGDIQLLSEERLTSRMINETMKHPALAKQLTHLLNVDSSQSANEDHRALVQTALAYSYASSYLTEEYRSQSSKPQAFSATDTQWVEKARKAMSRVEQHKHAIQENPGQELLLNTSYKRERSIHNGAVDALDLPDQKRVASQKILDAIPFEENRRTELPPPQGSFVQREFLDLSSSGISSQGKPVQSLERQHFSWKEQLDDGAQLIKHAVRTELTLKDGTTYLYEDTHVRDPTRRLIDTIKPFVSGIQYEHDKKGSESKSLSASHWQEKDLDWRLNPETRDKYYKHVHPAIVNYAKSVVGELLRNRTKDIHILDVAGGNGDLGERLIKEIKNQYPDVSIHYTLVDYSHSDVEMANERFSHLKDFANAQAIEKDMVTYLSDDGHSLKSDLHLPANGVDLLINSGGLLNSSITENPRSPEQFNRIYANTLKPGGFGIYSGLTSLQVNSNDHRQAGLEIHNLYDEESNNQMHVVRRPE